MSDSPELRQSADKGAASEQQQVESQEHVEEQDAIQRLIDDLTQNAGESDKKFFVRSIKGVGNDLDAVRQFLRSKDFVLIFS